MKFLILLLGIASATDLTVVNKTGADIRITRLKDKCSKVYVSEEKPVYIRNRQEVTFKNLTPVVHIYEVCGSGYCSSSALGFKDNENYTLKVVLDGGMITGNQSPDVWPGNLECP